MRLPDRVTLPRMVNVLLGAALLAAVSIQQVSDPRPSGRVTDQASVLSPEAEIVLNERAEGIRRDLGHDVLIVTVDNIVGGTPKQFSTALFNLWGIGDAARNDGVLLLLVTGQRRLEIETGIGMEAVLTDAWLQSMQQEAMVPAFKRGDLPAGLIAGLSRIDGELRGRAQAAAGGTNVAQPLAREVAYDGDAPTPSTVAPMSGGEAVGWLAGLLGVLGTMVMAPVGLFVWLRNRSRRCPNCKTPAFLLDEVADDAHLTEAQKLEERLGSVNYMIFVCPTCPHTKSVASAKWFSGYAPCGSCGVRAAKSVSTTLVAPTYDHGGQVQVDTHCSSCNRRSTNIRHTARRTRSSSSSSSSFGSRSSGSRSSSSSSGGRSRGGGSGSSW